MLTRQVQTAIRVLFPPNCVGCGAMVESEFALCGPCWRKVPFIAGPVCADCGVPVLARSESDVAKCDDCQRHARPWASGHAALLYEDLGRKLVLGLKHGDRQDVARAAAGWLHQAARRVIFEDTVIAPVPLHWRRLVARRYNQSALLAMSLAQRVARPAVVDLLRRDRYTQPLERATEQERFDRLHNAMSLSGKHDGRIRDRAVLLVDDVMTSGATLTACTVACQAAGARRVDVLALARVAKAP